MKMSPAFCLLLGVTWLSQVNAEEGGVAYTGQLYGGTLDGESTWSGYGNLTVPFLQDFGLHIEGLVDTLDKDDSQNIGAHLYWRNPNAGLFGLITSHSQFETGGFDTDIDSVGLEGEVYFGPLALAGQYAWISSDDVFIDDEDYMAVEVHLTASDAWYLSGGQRGLADEDIGYAEVNFTPSAGKSPFSIYGGATWDDFESQYLGVDYVVHATSSSNLSVFLEGDQGEDDFDGVFLGVIYSHGPVQDAPLITLFSDLKGGF